MAKKNESIRDMLENLTTYITDPQKGKPYLVKKINIDTALADIKRILKKRIKNLRPPADQHNEHCGCTICKVVEMVENLE